MQQTNSSEELRMMSSEEDRNSNAIIKSVGKWAVMRGSGRSTARAIWVEVVIIVPVVIFHVLVDDRNRHGGDERWCRFFRRSPGDLDWLALYCVEAVSERRRDGLVGLEADEAESTWLLADLVGDDDVVGDGPELGEVVVKLVLGEFHRQTAQEEFLALWKIAIVDLLILLPLRRYFCSHLSLIIIIIMMMIKI